MADSARELRTDLSKSIDLIHKCSKIQLDLDKSGYIANDGSSALASAIDKSVLDLNTTYLRTLAGEASSQLAALASADLEAECEARKYRARDASKNLQILKEIYTTELAEESFEPGASHNGENDNDIDFDAYLKFVRELYKVRFEPNYGPFKALVQMWWREFKRSSSDDDADILAGAVEQSLTCPLTLKTLEEPVRAPCGHVYSEGAISDLLRYSAQKCPSKGCSCVIRKKDLVRDHLMDLQVDLSLRQAKQHRALPTVRAGTK